jgi:hypothetical protein
LKTHHRRFFLEYSASAQPQLSEITVPTDGIGKRKAERERASYNEYRIQVSTTEGDTYSWPRGRGGKRGPREGEKEAVPSSVASADSSPETLSSSLLYFLSHHGRHENSSLSPCSRRNFRHPSFLHHSFAFDCYVFMDFFIPIKTGGLLL